MTALVVISFSGCSKSDEKSAVSDVSESGLTTQNLMVSETTETQTVTTTNISESLEVTNDIYIYDNARVLSTEAFQECNEKAMEYSKQFKINVAVVTTNDIQNLSPSEYAKKCYNEIFKGEGNGFLVLINNDTNNDYIYKNGSASLYISETAEKEMIFSATRHIVNNDFKTGILELLSLAEFFQQNVEVETTT